MITGNTISLHLPRSRETPVSAFLLPGWLQVLWNRAPDPAQPMGHRLPARPKREPCSWRDGGSGENVEALGDEWGRLSGSAAQQISEAWSHLSEATPHMSKQLIDYVCALPHISVSRCQQTCMGCFLWPSRFYQGFHLNSLSTNLNLALSWEEFKHGFTHLQGSQNCSLFQPAHLGRCVYTKDAPPVVIFPLRWGRWNCLPGIYHSFSS